MLLRSTTGCKSAAVGRQHVASARAVPRLILKTTVGNATSQQAPDSGPLIFYDISSPIEPRSYAPNPSKSRLALSFKRMPFKTTWVDILDIPKVRKGLNCAPVRKLNDGSDYYTLPMLEDPASGRVIGESFDIANYLDEAFLESGERLFPSDSTGTGLDYESPHKDASFFAPLTSQQAGNNADYARFNWHVDTTFSCHVALVCEHMPFNPDTAEAVRDMFARRAGVNSWDDLCIRGEAREQLKASFEQSLASLAELYMVHEDGPYLEGSRATYTDLIVGGWLIFMSAALPADEWRDFRAWHGGVFAQLHDALQKNYIQCT